MFLGHDEGHLSPTSSGREEDKRLFLALSDPREGMRSPCTLTVQIGAGDSAPVRSYLWSSGDILGISPGFLDGYGYCGVCKAGAFPS